MREIVITPKSAIRVKVGEASYDVRKPTNKQLKEFSQATAEEGLDKTINFLAELGLPADVSWEMDPESLKEIVEALIGDLKKNQ